MIWVLLQSESPGQRNDAITFFIYLWPYLKASSVFNVLETCRVYLLAIDLGIVKFIKNIMERFFEKCENCRHGPNYVQKL